MSNLELLNEQWIEMCSDLAVILAEEYGDGSLETIKDDNGDEYYTERSQERYNDYYDEAEGIAAYLAEGRDGDIKPDYTKFGEEIIDAEV